MNNLRERLNQELKEAQLKRDEIKLSVLRMALAALQNKEIEKRTKLSKTEAIEKLEQLSQLSEEEVLGVLAAEAKKRRESISAFKQGNRLDLVAKEERELKTLEAYLPAQLSEDEVRGLAREAIGQTGAKTKQDLGKVMAALLPRVKQRADGQLVSRIVQELLS